MESSTQFAENDNLSDVTTAVTRETGPLIYSVQHLVITSVVLGLMILCTIIGNLFVIAAIILEKNLHSVANYLILSLAVADLMVASIVMPISVVGEVSKRWFFRSEICDMWVSMDILSCTASIFHLVAISIDRYWAVTNIDYMRNRTAKRILTMIALVWFAAMSISIPAIFLFKDDNDPTLTGVCMITQDHLYTIFSTVGAFYLPTVIMLIIYARIFSVARQRIHKKRFVKKQQREQKREREARERNASANSEKCNSSAMTEMTLLKVQPSESPISRCEISEVHNNGSSGSGEHDDNENKYKTNGHMDSPSRAMLPKTSNDVLKAKKQKEKLEMKRERKAARTLAIITGAFIMCWLPFFILAIIGPFIRESVAIPQIVESITLWLGYCNSLLNPIIYTVFNPEFRIAFQKILFGKYSRKYRRTHR